MQFTWCLSLICLHCLLVQIESQCQSTASVNSANVYCQATNVTFTCEGSRIHIDYALVLHWLESQVSVVYSSAVAKILRFRDFEISAPFYVPLAMFTEIIFWLDVRARGVVNGSPNNNIVVYSSSRSKHSSMTFGQT